MVIRAVSKLKMQRILEKYLECEASIEYLACEWRHTNYSIFLFEYVCASNVEIGIINQYKMFVCTSKAEQISVRVPELNFVLILRQLCCFEAKCRQQNMA